MKSNEQNVNWLPLITLFALVFAVWLLSWYLLTNTTYLSDWNMRGTFGDMFGSVNTLFSGLAFAGVIYAIILQRNELFLQRQELKQTRFELEGQKIQLKEQNENIRLQRFENTFFNLIDLHNSYIDRILVPGFGNDKGRNSFQEFDRKFTHIRKSNVNVINKSNLKDAIIESIKVFRKDYPDYLDIYICNVKNILNFIENTQNIDKAFYANLFKSQLSYIEIKFIHFFSVDERYGSDFISLLKRYEITRSVSGKYKL
jgi:nitrogen regulatory protein PII